MTNKEAIAVLEDLIAEPDPEEREALRLAIAALEKEALTADPTTATSHPPRQDGSGSSREKFVLNDEEWARFKNAVENPAEPTQDLIDLMKEAKRPGQDIPEGWQPIETAPAGKWLLTAREGEGGCNLCIYRHFEGEDREWIDQAGRTTITHSTFLPPTHWRYCPAAPPAPETP